MDGWMDGWIVGTKMLKKKSLAFCLCKIISLQRKEKVPSCVWLLCRWTDLLDEWMDLCHHLWFLVKSIASR
jgi:hypothetical protein